MFRLMMSGSQGFNKQADYTQQTVTKLTYEDACRKAYQWNYVLRELQRILKVYMNAVYIPFIYFLQIFLKSIDKI